MSMLVASDPDPVPNVRIRSKRSGFYRIRNTALRYRYLIRQQENDPEPSKKMTNP
jgi:hypothetical protein